MSTDADLRTLDEEWDDFLAGIEPTPGEGAREAELASHADHLLQRAGELEGELDRIDDHYREMKARLDHHREERRAIYQRRLEYVEGQMRVLVEAGAVEAEPGKKTRSLPHGVVGHRKAPDTVEIDDAEAALAWCKAHDVEYYTKEEPRKTPLAKWAKEHGGDLPPDAGARYIPGADHFYYRTERPA